MIGTPTFDRVRALGMTEPELPDDSECEVDMFDPTKGYTPDNVFVCSKRAYRLRWRGHEDGAALPDALTGEEVATIMHAQDD